MKRTIRWSILMAILGFILGLGFLIPVPPYEVREPASEKTDPPQLPYVKPDLPPGDGPLTRSDDTFSGSSGFSANSLEADRRQNILLDIHTVARSRYAKNTDAYVVTWFRPGGRDEIASFSYCDNYDYSAGRARTDLNRFATATDAAHQKFPCSSLSLDELRLGTDIIDTIFGSVLSLKVKNFDPRTGGTLSVIFAYHVSKVGMGNDYRAMDLTITLKKGIVTLSGPNGEYFDWFNLIMSEDILGFPSGVNSFELFAKGISVAKHKGNNFPKVKKRKK